MEAKTILSDLLEELGKVEIRECPIKSRAIDFSSSKTIDDLPDYLKRLYCLWRFYEASAFDTVEANVKSAICKNVYEFEFSQKYASHIKSSDMRVVLVSGWEVITTPRKY